MRLDIDLPWGGKLHFERPQKPPMSEQARESMMQGLIFLCVLGFFLVLFSMIT